MVWSSSVAAEQLRTPRATRLMVEVVLPDALLLNEPLLPTIGWAGRPSTLMNIARCQMLSYSAPIKKRALCPLAKAAAKKARFTAGSSRVSVRIYHRMTTYSPCGASLLQIFATEGNTSKITVVVVVVVAVVGFVVVLVGGRGWWEEEECRSAPSVETISALPS